MEEKLPPITYARGKEWTQNADPFGKS